MVNYLFTKRSELKEALLECSCNENFTVTPIDFSLKRNHEFILNEFRSFEAFYHFAVIINSELTEEFLHKMYSGKGIIDEQYTANN